MGFWERWVAGDIRPEWRAQREQRLDQERMPFPVHLQEELGPDAPTTVRVLDVGAGPISTVGLAWPGHIVDLVAVDRRAETYQHILREAGVRPRVPTVPGIGESLAEMFTRPSFDVVYCQNALDHSSDPLEAIRQMLAVTKATGFVYLTHAENEAESQHYHGLHQWNITVEDSSLVNLGQEQTA